MCVGACGPISSNANTSSSSYTILEGIFFAPILQNKQSALMHSSCGRAFVQTDHHGCKALAIAKLLAELARVVFSGNFAHPHAIKQTVGCSILLHENRRIRTIQTTAQSLCRAAIAK